MGKDKKQDAPERGSPKSTKRATAAALPAPVFCLTALLLFIFMSLPVGEEQNLCYYNLQSEGLSARPMITSAVCAALLFLVSLAYIFFHARAKNKNAARLTCSGICAFLCMGALTAACSLLSETGAEGYMIGPAPLLCIAFSLFAIITAAVCELFAL